MQDANSKLSRNFGTNDQMLLSKRIKKVFIIDTLFVRNKSKSSRGYSCMKIFLSDQGCVYVASMNSVSEFPKSFKMFTKEFGVPKVFIYYSHKCNKSK